MQLRMGLLGLVVWSATMLAKRGPERTLVPRLHRTFRAVLAVVVPCMLVDSAAAQDTADGWQILAAAQLTCVGSYERSS